MHVLGHVKFTGVVCKFMKNGIMEELLCILNEGKCQYTERIQKSSLQEETDTLKRPEEFDDIRVM